MENQTDMSYLECNDLVDRRHFSTCSAVIYVHESGNILGEPCGRIEVDIFLVVM